MENRVMFRTETLDDDLQGRLETVTYEDGTVEHLENGEVVKTEKVDPPKAQEGGEDASEKDAPQVDDNPQESDDPAVTANRQIAQIPFVPANEQEARAEQEKIAGGVEPNVSPEEWADQKNEETVENLKEVAEKKEEEREAFAENVEVGPAFVPGTIEEARAEGQKLAVEGEATDLADDGADLEAVESGEKTAAEEQSERAPEEKLEAEDDAKPEDEKPAKRGRRKAS